MAKPDAVERGLVGEIISRFERKGFKLYMCRKFHTPETLVAEHYKEHQGKSFYQDLISFTLEGPVFAMIWYGNITVARAMVGATRPEDALPGTIRGDFACSLPANLIHCSDGPESATHEVDLWTPWLEGKMNDAIDDMIGSEEEPITGL